MTARAEPVGAPLGEVWLTSHEICGLLGVSPATLRRWSDAGEIEAFTTPGGHRRFRGSEVDRLLAAGGSARAARGEGYAGDAPDAEASRVRVAEACRELFGDSEIEPSGSPERAALRELFTTVADFAEAARRRGLSSAEVGELLAQVAADESTRDRSR